MKPSLGRSGPLTIFELPPCLLLLRSTTDSPVPRVRGSINNRTTWKKREQINKYFNRALQPMLRVDRLAKTRLKFSNYRHQLKGFVLQYTCKHITIVSIVPSISSLARPPYLNTFQLPESLLLPPTIII